MKESRNYEVKESITNTFLKTVSAYANYGGGKIVFGIRDDGEVIGIDDPKQKCLDIENRINDSIDPVPVYTLEVDQKTNVITLEVEEGLHKPYLYKAKAYRRNDTATIEADRLELRRLILEGQDSTFEELPSKNQNLTFSVLERKLKEHLQLQSLTKDTLKTLELYKDQGGINVAGALLADENDFWGIDMVRFGNSINQIMDRETHEHTSILNDYDFALEMYRKYYQYEEIRGAMRTRKSLIPEEAFRESIANAIVHRTWDVQAHIHVAMFGDKIEITSPGGLPKGMNKEEYYRGGISVLRNRIIGNIFFRLHMIERFGTGIKRINEAYRDSVAKPKYEILENSITITLPVIQGNVTLSEDENIIFEYLKGRMVSSSEIVAVSGFGKTKVMKLLKQLMERGYVQSTGKGRGIRYRVDMMTGE